MQYIKSSRQKFGKFSFNAISEMDGLAKKGKNKTPWDLKFCVCKKDAEGGVVVIIGGVAENDVCIGIRALKMLGAWQKMATRCQDSQEAEPSLKMAPLVH
jgi:hypothetical protein